MKTIPTIVLYMCNISMTYLPSFVMRACVTIAPSGELANLAISFPFLSSHTPTQPRVTVTTKPRAVDILEKKKTCQFIEY